MHKLNAVTIQSNNDNQLVSSKGRSTLQWIKNYP